MVLSPNIAKPPDKGRHSNNSARTNNSNASSQRNSPVLYSKVHRRPAVTRESLLHDHSQISARSSSAAVDENTTVSTPVVIDTTYWGVSQSPGSIFFDISSRRESDREIYKLAFYQFKDYVGLVVRKSGPNRYLEINFDNEESRALACNEGLQFDNGMVIIRPVVACRPGSVIKRVTLQRLPWLRPQRLLDGLRNTLNYYGIVRDVGIVTDTDTGAFLGSGYAILDCSPNVNQMDPFLELSHVIEWVDPACTEELSSCFIHAYWKDMPTYCKYCHELGHNAIDCKEAPSNKRTCYFCFKPGHIRSQCPEKVALGKRRKGNPTPSSNSNGQSNIVSATAIEHQNPNLNASASATTDISSQASTMASDLGTIDLLSVHESSLTTVPADPTSTTDILLD